MLRTRTRMPIGKEVQVINNPLLIPGVAQRVVQDYAAVEDGRIMGAAWKGFLQSVVVPAVTGPGFMRYYLLKLSAAQAVPALVTAADVQNARNLVMRKLLIPCPAPLFSRSVSLRVRGLRMLRGDRIVLVAVADALAGVCTFNESFNVTQMVVR